MLSFLAKRWFLLLLCAGVCLAYVRPEWLRPVVDRLEPKLVVALALFLMAWGLDSRSLYQAAVRPWPALWAVAVSYGALPLIAKCVGWTFLSPDFALGLMIIASVPCTLSSAQLWTRMAGGNEAVVLVVVLLTTSTSWLATTFWLSVGTPVAASPDTHTLMSMLFVGLLGPVGAGQLLRRFPGAAKTATRYKKWLSVASQLFILGVMLKAAVGVLAHVSDLTLTAVLAAALACVGTHLAALALGLWGGRALRFARADCIAVAFACSQKTLPVSLLLFEVYYQHEYALAVVPIAFYHVGQLVVDTFIAERLAAPPQPPAWKKQ
jgi:sodium/bile acid cotransporter 7